MNRLPDPETLALLLELASPVRCTLLQSLREEPATLTQLSVDIGLSAQEIHRHLGRLQERGLVQRREGRAFHLSPYGNAVLEELPVLASLAAHRGFFEAHELAGFPPGLSFGPLAAAQHFVSSGEESTARAREVLAQAQRSVVYVGDEIAWTGDTFTGLIDRGVNVEVVLPRDVAAWVERVRPPRARHCVVHAVPTAPPCIAARADGRALLFLHGLDGRPDYRWLVHDGAGLAAWVDQLFAALRGGAGGAEAPTREGALRR